jgi:hypothetical protein
VLLIYYQNTTCVLIQLEIEICSWWVVQLATARVLLKISKFFRDQEKTFYDQQTSFPVALCGLRRIAWRRRLWSEKLRGVEIRRGRRKVILRLELIGSYLQ